MTAKDLFIEALKFPPEQREAHIESVCAHDPDLRNKVIELLRAHREIGSFLEKPAVGQTADFISAAAPVSLAGMVVAEKYKLLQEIGEGGMGTVYMAEQIQPVTRKVAIKLIRPGMDSRRVLARFEAERQALALMDHPHIAKILDAGATENGAPFFVMELVKGIPLTEYCDRNQLPIAERLCLFQRICAAVQHAHQKGIIHRDLKPSNILVENHDGKPVPKIIDFGLAKAMNGMRLTDRSLFTAFGTVSGTPLYMAPEQANFNAIDVDTRADIYALGVLLYELLTGTTPIARDTLKKAAFEEVMRVIREQDPPTPSIRISTSETLPSIAAQRLSPPAKLGRLLKGDLDRIVMKALAKERERRYETANSFAEDIQRFLDEEPVKAGPPTVRYRMGKFLKRNRGVVTAAALVALTVLIGLMTTTMAMMRAKYAAQEAMMQRALALENEMKARQAMEMEAAERIKADKAADEASGLTQFLLETVIGSRIQELVYQGKVRDLPLSEALRLAEKKLSASFKDQPLVEAKLRHYLGNGFITLGKSQEALAQLEKSLALYRREQGANGDDAMEVMITLARAYSSLNQTAKSVEILKKYLALKPPAKGVHARSNVMGDLADALEESGRFGESLEYRREIVALEGKVSDDQSNLPIALYNLGSCLMHLRKPIEAERVLRDSMVRYEKKGAPLDWFRFVAMGELGACLKDQKRYQEALPLLEEAYAELKKREGENIQQGPLADDGRANDVLVPLIEVLEKTGQKEKAAVLRKDLKPGWDAKAGAWKEILRQWFQKDDSAAP